MPECYNTASAGEALQVEEGRTHRNINFRMASFKKGTWRNYNHLHGLAGNVVSAIHRTRDGFMWFATRYSGVFRYDGNQFVNYTVEDGLPSNDVMCIYETPDNTMWFGTNGAGVSVWDGTAWASLDTRDGLVGNNVLSIYADRDGSLWFVTDKGLTCYHRSETSPLVYINSVSTDRVYRDLSEIPPVTVDTRVTIEYNAVDFKTFPEKRQYRCRVCRTQDSRPKTQDMRDKTRDSPESKEPYQPLNSIPSK